MNNMFEVQIRVVDEKWETVYVTDNSDIDAASQQARWIIDNTPSSNDPTAVRVIRNNVVYGYHLLKSGNNL